MAQQSESSVEEILESIKKVMLRDGVADPLNARRAAAKARPVPQPEPEQRAEEADDADGIEILELVDFEAEDADSAEAEAPLISSASREAMRESLAALAVMSEPGAAPQIVRSGETSLEGLVRDMLRPMLAEWLDRNLPDMVEQLVAKEIQRIVGKR